MMLTPEQRKWIMNEKEILARVIKAKQDSKAYSGIWSDQTRYEQILLIIQLHNVAMEVHNKELERQKTIEKGKERLKELKSDSDTV